MPEVTQGPQKPCPFCAEMIDAKARKCRHCNEWLSQYPVLFQAGKDRIWWASRADIRHGAGTIRVSTDSLRIEGQSSPAIAIVSTTLESSPQAYDYVLDEVERVVHDTDKRRLRIGIRRRGAHFVQWYQCVSEELPALIEALREVLPPQRVVERLSSQNGLMVQDLALNWSIAAVLLPIPFVGCAFSLTALIFGGFAVARAKSFLAGFALFLALASVAENGLIINQILTH